MRQQAEAQVVPSSSLVEVDVGVEVDIGVEFEVEVGVGVILLFPVGGWVECGGVGWCGVVGEVVDKAISAFN